MRKTIKVQLSQGFPTHVSSPISEQDFLRALPQANSDGPWLALSAGGVDGAFSAGVLNGLSASGTRPDFAVVTGVSAGALVAPYAFLGARYDEQLRTALTAITDADVFEAGRTRTSLLDTWPLRNLIEHRITPQLLADVAAEQRRGRRLFVVTVNLELRAHRGLEHGCHCRARRRRSAQLVSSGAARLREPPRHISTGLLRC